MPEEYAGYPKNPAVRNFTATLAPRPVPPFIVEKYALRLPAYPGVSQAPTCHVHKCFAMVAVVAVASAASRSDGPRCSHGSARS